jgi:hypothetical protein
MMNSLYEDGEHGNRASTQRAAENDCQARKLLGVERGHGRECAVADARPYDLYSDNREGLANSFSASQGTGKPRSIIGAESFGNEDYAITMPRSPYLTFNFFQTVSPPPHANKSISPRHLTLCITSSCPYAPVHNI